MGKVDGKVAIITGSSRGIGRDIAKIFAAEGAKVVCTARTVHEGDRPVEGSLDSTVAEIKAAGGEAIGFACDVSKEEDCEQLVRQTREAFGPCDILVNNAGILFNDTVKDLPPRRWIRLFNVNVNGPFMMSHFVLPDMIERHAGAIVNISSSGSTGPGRGPYANARSAGSTCYGSSKAALERFTQGLAEEVYQYGISVTSLSPSQIVVSSGALVRGLAKSLDDGEPHDYMGRAAVILATEPIDKVTGWVTYDQAVLKQYGLIDKAVGPAVDQPGSPYSRL